MMKKFCTVINCMDGRTQLPVIEHLLNKYNVDYVDTITEPGPCGIIASQKSPYIIKSILNRLKISIENHGSKSIAVVAHHDCAGNPVPKEKQFEQTKIAVSFLKASYPSLDIIGLWVNENWDVSEIL